jgi:hypothetical protein
MTVQFKNRIIGSAELDPMSLKANSKNWRKHPKRQKEALEGMLSQVGWVQDVIVNKTTGNLVDGHLRVSLAISKKEKSIPVKYVELTPKEEELVLATLDPLGSLAETDKVLLYDLIKEVSTDQASVQAMLSDLAKQEKLLTEQAIIGSAKLLSETNSSFSEQGYKNDKEDTEESYSYDKETTPDEQEKTTPTDVPGAIKMISLFLKLNEFDEFKTLCEKIREIYGKDLTITEVVLKGLRNATYNK